MATGTTMLASLSSYVHVITGLLRILQLLLCSGCLSDAFSNSVQFRVGVVVHRACLLQHLLHYINAPSKTLLT